MTPAAPPAPLPVRALIAEDEAHAANALRRKLAEAWPDLEVVAIAADGDAALEILRQTPVDVAFLDIRMPGRDGLEVAAAMTRPCLVVFVTAYERFAVEAFEQAAVDYLLKPVAADRLERTVARLKERLAAPAAPGFADRMAALSAFGRTADDAPLKWIRAPQGAGVRLIPVDDICYFEARDKYTTVWTTTHEHLIRTPLKDLEAGRPRRLLAGPPLFPGQRRLHCRRGLQRPVRPVRPAGGDPPPRWGQGAHFAQSRAAVQGDVTGAHFVSDAHEA